MADWVSYVRGTGADIGNAFPSSFFTKGTRTPATAALVRCSPARGSRLVDAGTLAPRSKMPIKRLGNFQKGCECTLK
eukprot:scaffold78729_cov63-Phaeocystis_antarctica.AAC.2